MNDVLNKVSMIRRLAAGEFGNTLRSWPSMQALEASDYRGFVYIRPRRISSTRKPYEIPFHKLYDQQLEEGDTFYEAPPNETRVLQGELMESERGLYLHFSTSKLPLRPALMIAGDHAAGVRSLVILRSMTQVASFDRLMDLLARYPGHVIEFTEFRERIGTEHEHLVVWEVRKY